MSEMESIIDELRRIHDGDAWHGPALREVLEGVAAEQAAARPSSNAHSICIHVVPHFGGVLMTRSPGRSSKPSQRLLS